MKILGINDVVDHDRIVDVWLDWEFENDEREKYGVPVEIIGTGRDDEPGLVATFVVKSGEHKLKEIYFYYKDGNISLDKSNQEEVKVYIQKHLSEFEQKLKKK